MCLSMHCKAHTYSMLLSHYFIHISIVVALHVHISVFLLSLIYREILIEESNVQRIDPPVTVSIVFASFSNARC